MFWFLLGGLGLGCAVDAALTPAVVCVMVSQSLHREAGVLTLLTGGPEWRPKLTEEAWLHPKP